MTEIETFARKWGDSIAIILPRKVVEKERIKERDRIRVKIKKEVSLIHLFGSLKTNKTAQELKDESRRGWR